MEFGSWECEISEAGFGGEFGGEVCLILNARMEHECYA